MSQLKLFSGQRLARPVGVDWFRQLKQAKLLNLKPGNFVWYRVDEFIECAEVTRPSARLDLKTEPKLNGVQVFCSSKTRIWYPCLILDKQPGIFYMITDREAAHDYYEKMNSTLKDPMLRLVGTG